MTARSKTITLFSALRQANLNSALISMVVAGLLLSTLMFFSLRAQVTTNLNLVARTIAYSVEAALMFHDRASTQEILEQIVEREGLEMAQVKDSASNLIADFEVKHQSRNLNQLLDHLVFPSPTVVIVKSNQHVLGYVSIRGNGEIFSIFFQKTLMVIALSLLVIGATSFFLARKTERSITRQLDNLAKNTLLFKASSPQERKAFEIAEFQQIDEQFRELLAELDAKTMELTIQQMNLKEVNASLTYLANHDELTNLGNRSYFNRCLELAIMHANQQESRLAVLYLDSDRFKRINDEYGHSVGDIFLVKSAQCLQHAVRRSDLVARLGGDEFAILLQSLDSPTTAIRVAEKILASPDIHIVHNGRELCFQLKLSIGIALYPDLGKDKDSKALILAADQAMYISKQNGGCCYTLADFAPRKPKRLTP
ncbi:MAG: diguanylate cyclase [Zoogloeaceae bacterium]|jgi:diguanylate cyclase (GGDEF)-like protein|nr:diguanylate cyclase [Zoogloeaceae bacterium]